MSCDSIQSAGLFIVIPICVTIVIITIVDLIAKKRG